MPFHMEFIIFVSYNEDFNFDLIYLSVHLYICLPLKVFLEAHYFLLVFYGVS